MKKMRHFNLGRFDPAIHRIARIRAAERGEALKDYIAALILDDVKCAEERRNRPSEKDGFWGAGIK